MIVALKKCLKIINLLKKDSNESKKPNLINELHYLTKP